MILTQAQNNEKTRFSHLIVYFGENDVVIKTIIPFNNEVTSFKSNYYKLDTLSEGKIIETGGTTEQKTEDKLSIAIASSLYCGTTKAYAIKIGNKDLEAQMSYSKSDIIEMKDAEVLGFVNNLMKTITPLLEDVVFKTYGITTLLLGALGTLATKFNGEIGLASNVVNSGTVADDNIDEVIKLMHDNIDMMELLVPNFQLLNPDFVAGFHLNAKTVDLGVHHGGVTGNVTLEKTGAALSDIKVEIVGTLKNDTTDVLGDYAIIKVKSCKVIVQASGPNVVTQQKVHTFHRGRIDPLDFNPSCS